MVNEMHLPVERGEVEQSHVVRIIANEFDVVDCRVDVCPQYCRCNRCRCAVGREPMIAEPGAGEEVFDRCGPERCATADDVGAPAAIVACLVVDGPCMQRETHAHSADE